jgi:DNA-binding NarL/FixJ family response regulator
MDRRRKDILGDRRDVSVSEQAINKIISGAMVKLDAVTRTQAVVNALRDGDIEL